MDMLEQRPLTGLVKIFLVQTYCGLVGFSLAHISLVLVQRKESLIIDAFLWGYGMLLLSILAAAVIAGIHTRAAWAVSACRVLCICTILASIAGFVQACSFVDFEDLAFGYRSSPFLFNPECFFLVSLLTLLPVQFAWFRYFGASAAVRGAFLGGSPQHDPTPPLGIGLLMVFCWVYSVGKVAFFLCLCMGLDEEAGSYIGRLGLILLSVVFCPMSILWVLRRPGANIKVFLGFLCGWFFISSLGQQTNLLFNIVTRDLSVDPARLLPTLFSLEMIPVATVVVQLLLGVFGWRVLAVSEDRKWFAPREDREDAFAGGLSWILLLVVYMCSIFLAYAGNGLAVLWFSDDIVQWFPLVVVALSVMGLGAGVASVVLGAFMCHASCRHADAVKYAGAVCFAVGVALALSLFGDSLYRALEDPFEAMRLVFSVRPVVTFLGLALFGFIALMRCRTQACRASSIPSVVVCFGVFATALVGGEIVQMLVDMIVMSATEGESSYALSSMRERADYLVPGFWLARFLCPLAVLVLLYRGGVNLGWLYTLCIVWLFGQFVSLSVILSELSFHSGAYVPHGFIASMQIAMVVVVLFMVYCAHSKEFAVWWGSRQRAAQRHTEALP